MTNQKQASEAKKGEEKKREETPPLRIKRAPTLEIDQIDKSRGKVDQNEKPSKVKVSQRGKSKGKGADSAQTERKHPPAPSNSTNLNESRFQRGGS